VEKSTGTKNPVISFDHNEYEKLLSGIVESLNETVAIKLALLSSAYHTIFDMISSIVEYLKV
jgi:hypothetical protein